MLLKRVWIHEPRIVYFKEIPFNTPFPLNLFLTKAKKLGNQFKKWGLIIDLKEAPPGCKSKADNHSGVYKISKFKRPPLFHCG